VHASGDDRSPPERSSPSRPEVAVPAAVSWPRAACGVALTSDPTSLIRNGDSSHPVSEAQIADPAVAVAGDGAAHLAIAGAGPVAGGELPPCEAAALVGFRVGCLPGVLEALSPSHRRSWNIRSPSQRWQEPSGADTRPRGPSSRVHSEASGRCTHVDSPGWRCRDSSSPQLGTFSWS
jgi:hypothetical protein